MVTACGKHIAFSGGLYKARVQHLTGKHGTLFEYAQLKLRTVLN